MFQYPVKRAEKFNTSIAKLGVLADGQTQLDQLRELITQIGNILGFVSMLKTSVLSVNAFVSELAEEDPEELFENRRNTPVDTLKEVLRTSFTSFNSKLDFIQVNYIIFKGIRALRVI